MRRYVELIRPRDPVVKQWEQQFSLDRYPGKDDADINAATFDGSQNAGVAARYWQEFSDKILDKYPARAHYESETYTLRRALVRMLKHLSDLPCFDQNKLPDHFLHFLEHDVLRAIESESQRISRLLLQVSTTVVRYLLGSGDKKEGRKLGISLLSVADQRFGDASAESTLLAKLVAESYVYDSPHKFEPWQQKWTPGYAEPVILRHLAHLESLSPPYKAAALNYFYGYARVLLMQERPDEAARLIRRAFDGRIACCDEVHTESDRFIDDLIRSLCETQSGKSYYGTGINSNLSWAIVDHLIDHALTQERLSEAEILFVECGRTEEPVIKTSSLTADADFRPRSGWPYIQRLLVKFKTPKKDWYWEDSRMYLCRWNEVTLAPIYPLDPFPRSLIKHVIEDETNVEVTVSALQRHIQPPHLANEPGLEFDARRPSSNNRPHRSPNELLDWGAERPSDFKRDDMVYSIENISDWETNIKIPFVPYEHFQCSMAWRVGFTYVDYVDLLRENTVGKWGLEMARNRACSDEGGKKRMPLLYVAVEEERDSDDDENPGSDVITSGFFNGVPSGPALIDTRSTIGRYNLVSSSWTDWTRFTLYQTAPEQTPNVTFKDEKPAKCHGYIMGRWAQGNLKEQWVGIQLFVVDADFGVAGHEERFNFALNPDAFTDMNTQSLCSLEKLVICGSLNPRMFRYSPIPRDEIPAGASLWRPSKKTKKQDTVLLDTFWEEMNRREAWDRTFEKRLRPVLNEIRLKDDDKEVLAGLMAERSQEEQRRKDWDAQHQKAQKP